MPVWTTLKRLLPLKILSFTYLRIIIMKIKVKLLRNEFADNLEKEINNFLKDLYLVNEKFKLIDIKYQCTDILNHYSALIIYQI